MSTCILIDNKIKPLIPQQNQSHIQIKPWPNPLKTNTNIDVVNVYISSKVFMVKGSHCPLLATDRYENDVHV